MFMGLVLDTVLGWVNSVSFGRRTGASVDRLTAPYLEMCRTKSAPSLNNGSATMVCDDFECYFFQRQEFEESGMRDAVRTSRPRLIVMQRSNGIDKY